MKLFVTGIGTDVGKTVASAILTEALEADYWKPIQAGDLEHSDTHKVKAWVSNQNSTFFDNAHALKTPMSPHAAAEIDKVQIQLNHIKRPETSKHLVIEGAGGILVPVNETENVIELAQPTDHIVVVSRHYLGSINHSLLTLNYLVQQGFKHIHLIFNGEEHPTTESIIQQRFPINVLGRINHEAEINAEVIKRYAHQFKAALHQLKSS
jgi:dethiobiotin synthetase